MHSNTSSLDTKKKPHIVILGAGFGGIYTFLHLRKFLSKVKVDITIINKTNYFLFTPLLHEVATGGLAHHQVVEAIRAITYKRGATIHIADILKVNTEAKQVQTSVGTVPYDYLVIATGASPEFHGIPGAEQYGLVLKSLSDAIKIRNRFIDAFEKAVETKDPVERRRLLTFVVVGGGATSVELAAEMAEFFLDSFKRFLSGKIPNEEIKIYLVARESELVMNFHGDMRSKAREILTQLGVEMKFGMNVTAVDANGVTLSDGSKIQTHHVLWMAGVKPNTPDADKPFPTIDRTGAINRAGGAHPGRIVVDEYLRVLDHPGIYALGDVATFEKQPIPMHAQMAVQASRVVTNNLLAEIRGKAPKIKLENKMIGDLMSVGQWQAIGHFFGITWTGPIAWVMWRVVYLFKFASWPKRVKIALDWMIDVFYPRDITRA